VSKRFIVIGHRGDGAGVDENTLASCKRAIKHGADKLELDVQLINGQLMLAHPPRQPKESLSHVLAGVKIPVVLHLKRRHFSRWHDQAALKQLANVKHAPGITVSSYWPGTLRHIRRHYPQLRRAMLTWWLGWDRHFAGSLGVSEFHSWHRVLTNSAIHKTDLPVIAYIPGTGRVGRLKGLAGVIADDVRSFARH
jgi:glycerophosphoryl diester phosphodiesterase